MIRKLLCLECGLKPGLHPEDVAEGWKQRKTRIEQSTRPADHGLTVNGEFHPMASLVCDYCGRPIDGAIMALTQWREDGEPEFWEVDYGATRDQQVAAWEKSVKDNPPKEGVVKVLAKSDPPTGEAKAKLIACFLGLGWWDQMSMDERQAFFERGEVLDSPFARENLMPLINRSNQR